MKTYFDMTGKPIYAGAMIRDVHNGSVHKVVRTTTQDGEENLGISATNPEFLKHHPDWEEEYYGLGVIGLDKHELVTMTYGEIAMEFRAHEREQAEKAKAEPGYKKTHLVAHIVVREDSFTEKYPIESRTYVVSSDNKAYQPDMGGYSVFAGSLDNTDPCIRLDRYLKVEKGGSNGWEIDYCYMINN